MEYLGIITLGIATIDISFLAGGVEGWTLIEIVLPFVGLLYIGKRLLQYNLLDYIRFSSILPTLFFIIVMLHIFTDPRFDYIFSKLSSYRVPKGGLRLYYIIFINTLIYYLVPIIVTNMNKMRFFLYIFLGIVISQIIYCSARWFLGITHLPWDSYSSTIYTMSGLDNSETRMILLGNMGFLLFCYSLILIKKGTIYRGLLILCGIVSLGLSAGRTMLFGSVIIGILYLYEERNKKVLSISIISLLILSLVYISYNPVISKNLPPLGKRFLNVLSSDNPEFQQDEYSRASMWKAQADMILQYPLWGSYNVTKSADDATEESIIRGDTHNVYIGIASRFGIPMLVIWLCFLIRQLWKIKHIIKNSKYLNNEILSISKWLYFSIITYYFMSMTVGGASGGHVVIILMLGLVDSVFNIVNKSHNYKID